MKTNHWLSVFIALFLFNVQLTSQCSIPGYSYVGSYEGSHYYLSDVGVDPATAHENAFNLGTYLASIGSAGENDFLAANLPGYVTIGLSDAASEGTYVWQSGEPLGYTNWNAGEPNDQGGEEEWVVINFGNPGEWNDIPNWVSPLYVVEFEDNDGDGTSDYCDACPEDPNKIEPGLCGCGVVDDDTDTDCDGVPDCNDVCAGGNDNIDNNGDGIPDCSQLLDYADYDPSWYCGKNKIMVCHNDNNQHTICISKSALAAHFNHGDKIGPCSTCENGLRKTNELREKHQNESFRKGREVDDNLSNLLQEVEWTILPNPASNYIDVIFPASELEREIQLLSASGQMLFKSSIQPYQTHLHIELEELNLEGGFYLIQLISENETHLKRIVIIK